MLLVLVPLHGDEHRWSLRRVPPLPGSTPPPLPTVAESPVRFLDRLLSATPEGRDSMLEHHSEKSRTYWRGKIAEYMEYSESERENRLRLSNLHWYLALLIRVEPENRLRHLMQIPEFDRRLVERRLEQWDLLQESLRKDILENIKVLQYVARLQGSAPGERASLLEGARDSAHPVNDQTLSWQQLSVERRQEMYRAYLKFCQLPTDRQQATLAKVPFPPVRRELRRQIELLSGLSSEERRRCLESLEAFAGMTPEAQARFLRSAERWRVMGMDERSFWISYVKRLPPLPPPLEDRGERP